ncbi:MAG TPA: helix-turn-helix transcriptional regulator [Beijerinckiaceae bacterium]|jgi:DNA-binding CsgD family transcriptional regulator|nr:helix-turn-helix transcriptional regulator [Beijerinckiaceae bacterium]
MLDDTRIAVRLAIADPVLAERMAAILSEIESIEVMPNDGEADLVIAQAQENSANARRGEQAGFALTAREAEVLALLAEGASNKAIARRLDISVHTAKFHVAALLDKLDAMSRTDAVVQAARLGLILL